MRNLKSTDLFKMMRIMRKANIKEEIVAMDMPKNLSGNESGMMIILQLLEAAPNAEKEIFEFLADIGEVDVKELQEDEFELLPEIIQHLQKQEKFTSFLEQAFKSTN